MNKFRRPEARVGDLMHLQMQGLNLLTPAVSLGHHITALCFRNKCAEFQGRPLIAF